jgi:hypothetical protein
MVHSSLGRTASLHICRLIYFFPDTVVPQHTTQSPNLGTLDGIYIDNCRYPWGNQNDTYQPVGWGADLETSDNEGGNVLMKS